MSEKPVLNAREHIADQVQSHEITPVEVSMAVQRLREVNAAHDRKVESFVGTLEKDETFRGIGSRTLKNIAEIALRSSHKQALHNLAEELGDKIADTIGISPEEIHESGSLQAQARFHWLIADDLTYSPSDLQINPKNGQSYAEEYKKGIQEAREKLLSRAEELAQS